jgi:hypothetical protein
MTTERDTKLVLDPRLAGTAMTPEDRRPDVRRNLPTTVVVRPGVPPRTGRQNRADHAGSVRGEVARG